MEGFGIIVAYPSVCGCFMTEKFIYKITVCRFVNKLMCMVLPKVIKDKGALLSSWRIITNGNTVRQKQCPPFSTDRGGGASYGG